MPTGVHKTMLQRPVLRKIIPSIVLQNPPIVTESAHLGAGKCFGIERGDPKPFVRGLLGLKLAFAVVIFSQSFFGTEDTDQSRVFTGKGQAFRVPEQDLVGFAVAWFGERGIGRTLAEQADGGLVQIWLVLLKTDHHIPADLLSQIEHGSLSVQGIEQKDVEKELP